MKLKPIVYGRNVHTNAYSLFEWRTAYGYIQLKVINDEC